MKLAQLEDAQNIVAASSSRVETLCTAIGLPSRLFREIFPPTPSCWNDIVSVSDEDLVGLTNLEVINLAANNFVETSISDRALDLPVLVAVDLSYNLFTVIPRFLPSGIINLTLFTNQLTELRADNLVRYTSLQNLDISNNNISIIHADTFSHTKDLLNLDLSYNKLTDESFPATLFFKTPRLRTLSLRFNQLDHLLQDLPETLQHLDYVGNRIKTLPALSFQSLPNLKSLWFWKCQVSLDFQKTNQLLIVKCLKYTKLDKKNLAEFFLIIAKEENAACRRVFLFFFLSFHVLLYTEKRSFLFK